MPIEIDIAHVARLARLAVDEAELEVYRRQLGVILEHAARVQAVDVDEGSVSSLAVPGAFRPDRARPSLDRDEVLSQAPDHRDGYFAVPPAMESS